MIITPWLRVGQNKQVEIFLSFGATEAKPPEDVDAIFDITETGTTLGRNNLKIIDTVMESTAVLVANKNALRIPHKERENCGHVCTAERSCGSTKEIAYFRKCERGQY